MANVRVKLTIESGGDQSYWYGVFINTPPGEGRLGALQSHTKLTTTGFVYTIDDSVDNYFYIVKEYVEPCSGVQSNIVTIPRRT